MEPPQPQYVDAHE